MTQGWRLLHIGFEGDDVSVAGINPWKARNWTRTGEKITVAHPSYPAQRHPMQVYLLDPENAGSVFAAGEFSNGVWGIYVPAATTTGRSHRPASSPLRDRGTRARRRGLQPRTFGRTVRRPVRRMPVGWP